MPSRFGGDVALLRRATKLPSCGVHQRTTSTRRRRRWRANHCRQAARGVPGDPVGHRQFLDFTRPFALDGGVTLDEVTVAYETWGTLDDDHSNAILLCHAWTGDSHAVGPMGHGHPSAGWWEDAVGPGLAIDTDRWFVVCANVLGGCQGSTGPASPHPIDGKPYGSRFPVVTIRDMVRAQVRLADHLVDPRMAFGDRRIDGRHAGPRVGDHLSASSRARSCRSRTCAQATAQQIAWGAIGRRAIRMDPNWRGGDYYDADDERRSVGGLSVARMVAQVTFRSDNVFTDRFGRELADGATLRDSLDLWQRFEVERYLDHHGEKLVRRFDANSYLIIGKAMDLHDVGRGRGGVAGGDGRINAPTLTFGISSDILYPSYQQRQIRDLLLASGTPASTSRSTHRTATTRS